MRKQIQLTALAPVCAGAIHTGADPVLDWNDITAQTVLAPGARPGATPILDFAVVQAAIHDAVQAYEKRYAPYAVDIQGAEGSVVAAVAKAAHDVLVDRFPSKAGTLNDAYDNYLSTHGLLPGDPGVSVGAQAAAAMIALRLDDGAFPAVFPDFVGAPLTGVWRPTPPANAPMAFPWVAEVTPFVVKSSDQFRPEPPAQLNSARYQQDYDEVKALGSLNSVARTPEQTQLAWFYADNFLAQWNRALRGIAGTYLDNTGDIARLFALAWLAAGDAFIVTWDAKIYYSFWRPVTATREGDNDGNRKTVGDATWEPFLTTPAYPDHSSGANAFVASLTQTVRLFFGTDKLPFEVTSNHPNASPNKRIYERITDAQQDLVDVRVYHGIHFRLGDEAGRKVGRQVAEWVYHHALRPLHGNSGQNNSE